MRAMLGLDSPASLVALTLVGIGSGAAVLLAVYDAATATDGDRWDFSTSLVTMVVALVAVVLVASAVRDWHEATTRLESRVHVLRAHRLCLQRAPSTAAIREAKTLLADAAGERELLVKAGARNQAAAMSAAQAELYAELLRLEGDDPARQDETAERT